MLVGGPGPPLWKIGVRQLGWGQQPNISGKIKHGNQTTNQTLISTSPPSCLIPAPPPVAHKARGSWSSPERSSRSSSCGWIYKRCRRKWENPAYRWLNHLKSSSSQNHPKIYRLLTCFYISQPSTVGLDLFMTWARFQAPHDGRMMTSGRVVHFDLTFRLLTSIPLTKTMNIWVSQCRDCPHKHVEWHFTLRNAGVQKTPNPQKYTSHNL